MSSAAVLFRDVASSCVLRYPPGGTVQRRQDLRREPVTSRHHVRRRIEHEVDHIG